MYPAGRIAWLLAVAGGCVVANLYYCQPLLTLFSRSFGVPPAAVSALPATTQAGYLLGLLCIVPMGDRLERRGMMVGLTAFLALVLAGLAKAPTLGWLMGLSFLTGLGSVAIQVAVPFAATLGRDPAERGHMVGIVMSGVLVGVLAARTVSGVLAAHWSWRLVYGGAAVVMGVLSLLLQVALPQQHPHDSPSLGELLRSMGRLWLSEPLLRRHAVVGAMGFAAFSAFWSTLDFYIEGPHFGLGSQTVGVLGLFGVVGALMAPLLGRLAGTRSAAAVNGTALGMMAAAFIGFGSLGGSLAGLAVFIVGMDLGVQASHISNQTRIFSLSPQHRNRLNAVYMVCYFIGGTLGSLAGAAAWHAAGWPGVCGVGFLCALGGLAALFGL
ncbi:MAG TPA: MFS transporter [Candidatus Xenobia bacterium]